MIDPRQFKAIEKLAAGVDRRALPYRRAAHVFLQDDAGNIIGKLPDSGKHDFIRLPGGGIDEGEEVLDAVHRELREELGAEIADPQILGEVKWDWPRSWADNPKRLKRYAENRGGHDYFVGAKLKSIGDPTSLEGDAFINPDRIPIEKAFGIVARNVAQAKGESLKHRQEQLRALHKLLPSD